MKMEASARGCPRKITGPLISGPVSRVLSATGGRGTGLKETMPPAGALGSRNPGTPDRRTAMEDIGAYRRKLNEPVGTGRRSASLTGTGGITVIVAIANVRAGILSYLRTIPLPGTCTWVGDAL
jgi:hypothetical protein